jgi:hypothetical protein
MSKSKGKRFRVCLNSSNIFTKQILTGSYCFLSQVFGRSLKWNYMSVKRFQPLLGIQLRIKGRFPLSRDPIIIG